MARSRVKMTAKEAKRFANDIATPEEREWLNAFEQEVRPDLSPSIISDRVDGGFWVLVLMRKRQDGQAFCTYPISLNSMKREVLRAREQRAQREQAEIECAIGAYI